MTNQTQQSNQTNHTQTISKTNHTQTNHTQTNHTQTNHTQTISKTLTNQINPNLPSMPFEIKQKIVYWVYWSHSHGSSSSLTDILKNQNNDDDDDDDDDQFEDISDSESESRYDKWKNQSNQKSTSTNNKILSKSKSDSKSDDDDDDQSTIHSRDSDDDCLIDIRSLASVDRTFYELCCPYLYQSFDSQGYTVEKLKFTLNEIIKPHSNHIKKVWWRVSKSELIEFEDIWNESSLDEPAWDPKSRSEILLEIFVTCSNIIDLDIDLDPKPIIPLSEPFDLNRSIVSDSDNPSSDHQMPNLFIKPISQLTSLTHLSLTSPTDRPAYTEDFLVEIISNLTKLQSFGCSRVNATYPIPTDDQAKCLSPLGIHLSNLNELIELDFEKVNCLDSSWNQLEWKSSLKEITLEDCQRVSIKVLYGFLNQFQNSLNSISLDNIPFHDNSNWNLVVNLDDLFNEKIKFELPNLINLEISNYIPIGFLRLFQSSQKIEEISLDLTPAYTHRDLEELIQDSLWPKLKKLSITSRTAILSASEIESLEVLCQGYQIEFNLDDDSSDDDDDSDEDDDEVNYDDEDEFEEDHWAHHFGQDDDDDDEDDEDEEDDDVE